METTTALQPIQYTAGGDIEPCRFVIHSSSAENTVTKGVGATVPYAGISQEGALAAPTSGAATKAAGSGDPLRVYGNGEECSLELGSGGATQGGALISDANGKGVAVGAYNSGTGQFVGAIALQTGVEGEKIRVRTCLYYF